MAQPEEQQVKTAILYNFAKFVTWPEKAIALNLDASNQAGLKISSKLFSLATTIIKDGQLRLNFVPTFDQNQRMAYQKQRGPYQQLYQRDSIEFFATHFGAGTSALLLSFPIAHLTDYPSFFAAADCHDLFSKQESPTKLR